MKVIDIERLTNKINFTTSEDFKIYPTADIGCPSCDNIVSINLKNLEKHAFSEFSNFTSEDKKEFEIFAELSFQTKPNSFLDYYCPKCKKPIRIYYNSWAGGRFEGGFDLTHLLTT